MCKSTVVEVFRDSSGSALTSLTRRLRLSGLSGQRLALLASSKQSTFDISAASTFCNVCREGRTRSLPPVVEVFRDSSGSALTSLTRRSRLTGLSGQWFNCPGSQ